MKKWCFILALLLLLTGCGKQFVPIDRPHSLKVSYGEEAVYAHTTGYQWYWKDGRETASATVDAVQMGVSLQTLPCLRSSQETALQLEFSKAPDKLLVQRCSAEDQYQTFQEIDVVNNSLPAPSDDGDYRYVISAVWLEGADSCWGSCTYEVRFSSDGVLVSNPIQLDVAADLDLKELLQLDASQLLGVEFLNNYEGTTRTCRSGADKEAILRFFQNNLVTDMQHMTGAVPATEYMLRLVTVSGSQVTLAYGGSSSAPCLTVGETSYSVAAMDLKSLWNELGAGAISQEAEASGKNYLDMSNTFPGESWGTSFAYGYLRQMDQSVTYDEMRWLEDAAAPDGFVLEPGWTGQSGTLSADCQFWILEDHHTPYRRVTAEDLWQWTQDAEGDALYRIYTSDGEITAICQQELP